MSKGKALSSQTLRVIVCGGTLAADNIHSITFALAVWTFRMYLGAVYLDLDKSTKYKVKKLFRELQTFQKSSEAMNFFCAIYFYKSVAQVRSCSEARRAELGPGDPYFCIISRRGIENLLTVQGRLFKSSWG